MSKTWRMSLNLGLKLGFARRNVRPRKMQDIEEGLREGFGVSAAVLTSWWNYFVEALMAFGKILAWWSLSLHNMISGSKNSRVFSNLCE
ncbi:unnamed protein product [Brassica rapa subsp. narinosa]